MNLYVQITPINTQIWPKIRQLDIDASTPQKSSNNKMTNVKNKLMNF